MYKFVFADIGEGLHEGLVGEVHVKVGDNVKEGDALFVVETDKVTTDITAPVTGKIVFIKIKTGETVHVGDEIFHFQLPGESAESAAPAAPAPKVEVKTEAVSEAGASVVGEVKVSNEVFSVDKLFAVPAAKTTAAPTASAAPSTTTNSAPQADVFDIKAIKPIGDGELVDLVIIGAGPGGYTLGAEAAKDGLKTVVIEREFPGGVCLNVGCIPTKTLLRSAQIYQYVKEAKAFGVEHDAKSVALNWNVMQGRKDKVRTQLRNGVSVLLKGAGAEYITGEAVVVDRYNVTVNKRKFTTKVIVLATGSQNIDLPLPGFAEAKAQGTVIDSTGAIDLNRIPKSLAVIGGGVIGLEIAFLYSDLGAEVTVLEGSGSILGPTDGEAKALVMKLMQEKGITLKLNAQVTKMDKTTLVYHLDGAAQKLKVEKVLVAVGRRATTLGLDKTLGIELTERRGFKVNAHLQTSVSNIFAIGDALGQVMLAHSAYKQAHVVREFLRGRILPWDNLKIPAVIYLHPEISSLGYSEEELKAAKTPYFKVVYQNKFVARVLVDNDNAIGYAKLLVDPEYGKILGAQIINTHSSDMIAEIAAINELEGTVYELAATVHPHPAIAEVLYEAALQAVEKLEALRKQAAASGAK